MNWVEAICIVCLWDVQMCVVLSLGVLVPLLAVLSVCSVLCVVDGFLLFFVLGDVHTVCLAGLVFVVVCVSVLCLGSFSVL